LNTAPGINLDYRIFKRRAPMTLRHKDEYTTLDLIGFGFWELAEHLNRIERKLTRLLQEESAMALDLTQITADVSANTDAVASAASLLATLAQEIRDNADDPAALAALATSLEQNTADLSAAVAANTPAAP